MIFLIIFVINFDTMSSKEDKQQYLYAEIIDGGFDPEEFQ
jgi:hypothetical protein